MSAERPEHDERRVRVYPSCCTSAFCGKGSESCPTCPNFPVKRDFDEWKERTGAVADDPIWCPTVYTATR